jgi:hypothetical protein
MKAGFDGAKIHPLRGQFTWESQSVYLGFNYMFERGKQSLQRKQRDNDTNKGGGGLF